MHDLFEGVDTHPSHHHPVHGHVSEHTPVYHTGVPHVAQSASVHHFPSNATGMSRKNKTWYGVKVPIKERGRPGPLSLGFGFKEIRKAAMEGRPLHAQHVSGPSTPVSSTVPAPNQHRASKSSKPIKTYSAAVASTLGHAPEIARFTRGPSLKQQRKDARREMKSTLDRNPHQTLRRRLSVLETVRSALSGVRMDLIEDMKLNELFAEPTDWSSSREGSAPATSTAEAVVLAGLGGIRHLLDAALNVPTMVAHALHVDDQQEETEHSTAVHHGQRHHHSHGHSKAVTLKTSRSGSVDFSLYPEEEPSYSQDADSQDSKIHENPAHPNTVSEFVIEMPYHRDLYPEENAGYPRTDAFSLHRNPPHPGLHDVVELPYSSSSSSSSVKLSTLTGSRKTHSYNHSKAVALHRPLSPLYFYPEEQSSYPRDAAHDVASDEYDPRADDAVHQSRVYAPNPYIPRKQVHEIQLDDEDQHSHHDAHPTLTESAASAVSSSLDRFKAMFQSIHLPEMVVGGLLPEAHEYLQAVQHHDQQQPPQDHRPVLRYKEQGHEKEHEHEHEHGEGSATHHISRFAEDRGSFIPSEHHRRHVEHFPTSSYPPVHTSSSSSSSAAAAASLAAKHASPISVLPPEASSRAARLSRPPTGFGRGADDDLGDDETIVWTKSVKTTSEFFEVEDDNVDINEFSHQNQRHGQQHMDYQGQHQEQRPQSHRHAQ